MHTRDASPKQEIHPVSGLYFPGDISKGEPEKVEAVFEIKDNVKSMSIDLRPIGANNLPRVIVGDVDCPNECFIFSFLLGREVFGCVAPGIFKFPDQKERYEAFKKENTEYLKECHAKNVHWTYKGKVLDVEGGIYTPN